MNCDPCGALYTKPSGKWVVQPDTELMTIEVKELKLGEIF